MWFEPKTTRSGGQFARGTLAGFTALAMACAAFTAGSAHAADKYVLEDVEETRVEFGSGWYIRGDIGAAVGGIERDSVLTTASVDRIDETSTNFGFRAGVGYRLSPNLRIDGTFDYHSRSNIEFEGSAVGACIGEQGVPVTVSDPLTGSSSIATDAAGNIIYTPTGTTVFPQCTQEDRDSFNSQDMLVNAYYDLSPLGRFTPYIGAGLGVTRLEYSSRQGDRVCDPAEDVRCFGGDWGEETTYSGTVNEGVSYHLAGALTLGTSFDISKNLKADVSYQLTKTIESPLWGGSDGYDAMGLDSFRHSARVGLRYELW